MTSVAVLQQRRSWLMDSKSSLVTQRSNRSSSTFSGGITSCDAVANGIVQALEMLSADGTVITKPGVPPRRQQRGRRTSDPLDEDRATLLNLSTRWTTPLAGSPN